MVGVGRQKELWIFGEQPDARRDGREESRVVLWVQNEKGTGRGQRPCVGGGGGGESGFLGEAGGTWVSLEGLATF